MNKQQAAEALKKLREELFAKEERVKGKEARVDKIKERWQQEQRDLVRKIQNSIDARNRIEDAKDEVMKSIRGRRAARLERQIVTDQAELARRIKNKNKNNEDTRGQESTEGRWYWGAGEPGDEGTEG
jgi:hypothetical protein